MVTKTVPVQSAVGVSGVIALVLALLAVAGVPTATAQSTPADYGGSAGTGTEAIETTSPQLPLCFGVDWSTYTVRVNGVFTAAGGSEVYQGPADITFDMGDDDDTTEYFVSPQGTYAGSTSGPSVAPPRCDETTFGPLGPITTQVKVEDPNPDPAGIECGPTTGSYFRVNTNFSVTWTGQCTVTGNVSGGLGAQTSAGTEHVFKGNLFPCTPGVSTCTVGPYASNQLQGSWDYID